MKWVTRFTQLRLRISPPKPPETRADQAFRSSFARKMLESKFDTSRQHGTRGSAGRKHTFTNCNTCYVYNIYIYTYTVHSFIYTKLWWKVVKWQIKKWRLWNADLFPVQSHVFLLKMIQGFSSSKKSIYSDRTMGWTSKRGCALPFFPQDAGKKHSLLKLYPRRCAFHWLRGKCQASWYVF
jgi:hypothetical protein